MPPHQDNDDFVAQLAAMPLDTRAVHGDKTSSYEHEVDVAPPIHLSSTYRYNKDPDKLVPESEMEDHSYPMKEPIYSRYGTPTLIRLEAQLSSLLGQRSLAYGSGLSAEHAVYVLLRPKRVAILAGGYHGTHAILRILNRMSPGYYEQVSLESLSADANPLGPGDVVHLETPINPTGEALSIQKYADLAHAAGALLVVDTTFAPPPLQDPFAHGADFAVHSATKYLGGHSDVLAGAVAARDPAHIDALGADRHVLGGVPGALEAALLLRSLRTLGLRVRRQSATAAALVAWLAAVKEGKVPEGTDAAGATAVKAVLVEVLHSSVQSESGEWLAAQMPGGQAAVFAARARDGATARKLASGLRLFSHATSLGGVESLVEWRKMSDASVDDRLLRFSIGIEDEEELRKDIIRACVAIQGGKEANGEN